MNELTRHDGPRIVMGPLQPPRDHPDYRKPSDHTEEGLFADGPEGDACNLGPQIYFTHCAVSAPTPENERKRYVRQREERAEFLRSQGIDPNEPATPTQVWNGGRFSRPVKPANSGRKKKAA